MNVEHPRSVKAYILYHYKKEKGQEGVGYNIQPHARMSFIDRSLERGGPFCVATDTKYSIIQFVRLGKLSQNQDRPITAELRILCGPFVEGWRRK